MSEQSQPLNIYQRINAVMQEETLYIKRGSAGQGTGVLYDEVISKLAPLLVKHGIVSYTEKANEARNRKNQKDSYIYESDFNVHYVNIDNPDDKLTVLVESHAMDAGDKAPGKAITYASKISHLKVFGIETGTNDESREELRDTLMIDEQTAQFLEQQMVVADGNGGIQWSKKGQRLLAKYKIGAVHQLKQSKLEAFKKDLAA